MSYNKFTNVCLNSAAGGVLCFCLRRHDVFVFGLLVEVFVHVLDETTLI